MLEIKLSHIKQTLKDPKRLELWPRVTVNFNRSHNKVQDLAFKDKSTTMRYHFMPVRMAFIKADRKWQHCQGCGETGALRPCQWRCEMIQSLCKRVLSYKCRNEQWQHLKINCLNANALKLLECTS